MYSNDPELRNVQQVVLEIAQYFVDFCNKHDLLCYFCGGGCIGSIRHQGLFLGMMTWIFLCLDKIMKK